MNTQMNPLLVHSSPFRARAMAPGLAAGISRDLIERVVDRFYALVRQDDLIGPVFNGAIPTEHWPAHLAKLADFWSSVLLLTGDYKGKPVPAHARFTLTDAHFLRWLELFEGVVVQECPGAAAELFLSRAWRIANSLRMAAALTEAGTLPVLVAPLERESRI